MGFDLVDPGVENVDDDSSKLVEIRLNHILGLALVPPSEIQEVIGQECQETAEVFFLHTLAHILHEFPDQILIGFMTTADHTNEN